MALDTARLRLVPYGPADLLAFVDAAGPAPTCAGYPVAPGLFDYLTSDMVSAAWLDTLREAAAAGAGPDPWAFGFAAVHRDEGRVVGSAGFKGPPTAEGVAEVAYAVAPAYERQGYATEAAGALVDFARADGRVRRILAHTLPAEGPSPAVLRKCGFAFAGEVVDPDDGPVWRWERAF